MSCPIILPNPIIPPGATILVTGANGLIATHIIDQLLAANYPVRGTVRNLQKSAWLSSFFTHRYPKTSFTLAEVPDMSLPDCFDKAVKGCEGVIHTTSSVDMMATSPEPAVGRNVKTVLTALEAASGEKAVKRFVLTSSLWTVSAPKPDIEFVQHAKMWNEEAVGDAYAVGTERSHGMTIFMAGKTMAEKACWEFVEEKKPGFGFNAVLPDTVFGYILSPENQGIPSTAGLVKMLYDGQNIELLKTIAPQYFIDVVDNAKLHVAALLHPGMENERLLGAARPWNWNDILEVLRKLQPEKDFIEDLDLGRDVSTVENESALKVLGEVFGMSAWTGLEDSVKETVKAFSGENIEARFHNGTI